MAADASPSPHAISCLNEALEAHARREAWGLPYAGGYYEQPYEYVRAVEAVEAAKNAERFEEADKAAHRRRNAED